MLKRLERQLPFIVAILLPILFALSLDVTPYSKTIASYWKNLNFSQREPQTEEWIEKAQAILRNQPWQADLWSRLAEKQFEIGDFDEAIVALQKAEAIVPLQVDQTILLGQIYWETNQKEKAYVVWQSVIQKSDVRAADLRELVQIQQSKNDWFGAFQTLKKWQQIEPDNQELMLPLIYSQIIFEPETAIHSISQSNLRELKLLLPEIEIIQQEENTVYQMILSGNLLSAISEWDYATAAFAYVTRMDPAYAEGWAFYGNALINSGKDGYSALNKALSISPKSVIARAYIASYWRMRDDFIRSLEIYQELSKDQPDQAIWQQELGNTYIMSGNPEKALQAFINTTRIEPDNAHFWINLARFCGDYKLELQETGLPAARQALLIDEQSWEATDTLGWLLLILEDYTSAERFLSAAYQLAPESALVNLHLGQLYYFQNKTQLANYFLKRTIEFADQDELIQLANKFLSQ